MPRLLFLAVLALGLAPLSVAQTCPDGSTALEDAVCLVTNAVGVTPEASARRNVTDFDSTSVPFTVRLQELFAPDPNTGEESIRIRVIAEWTHVPGTPYYSMTRQFDGAVANGASGAGRTRYEPRPSFPEPIVAPPGGLVYYAISVVGLRGNNDEAGWQEIQARARANAETFRTSYYGTLSAVQPALTSEIQIAADSVRAGEPFDLEVVVTNPWAVRALDVRPTGDLAFTDGSGQPIGAVDILEAPTPIDTLAGGASATLRYRVALRSVGLASATVPIGATWTVYYREPVEARPICSIGGLRTSVVGCTVTVGDADIIVNVTDDGDDADRSDAGVCDADESTDGLQCTLRAAIQTANDLGGASIAFDIEGEGPHTIAPTVSLPPITVPVVLDATSQSGYNGAPVIIVDGAGVPNATGLRIVGVSADGGQASAVRGIAIVRFEEDGILIQDGGGTIIEANYIGVDADGTSAAGNGRAGVMLRSTVSSTLRNNVISGNDSTGVSIFNASGGNHEIVGNRIGTDADGTAALGNRHHGIWGFSPESVTIRDNVIAGNAASGLFLSSIVRNAEIVGNRIGTNATGTAALRNVESGIVIDGACSRERDRCQIGGPSEADRNVISGNGEAGIRARSTYLYVLGNRIGTTTDGLQALSNEGNGIDLVEGIPGTNPLTRGRIEGNVVSGNRGAGMSLVNAISLEVVDNNVGTTPDGTAALGNDKGGIQAHAYAFEIRDNVLSGNGEFGFLLRDLGGSQIRGGTLAGNRIGTNTEGTAALPNRGPGIWLDDNYESMMIGGESDEDRNLISGNEGDGILLVDELNLAGAPANRFVGNWIGLDVTGTRRLPNGGAGVHVQYEGSLSNAITHDQIGFDRRNTPFVPDRPANVISGNLGPGVWIEGDCTLSGGCVEIGADVTGNYIGTDPTGTQPIGNGGPGVLVESGAGAVIQANLISANAEGIVARGGGTYRAPLGIARNLIGATPSRDAVLGNFSDGIRLQIDGRLDDSGDEGLEPSVARVIQNTIVGNQGDGIAVTGGASGASTAARARIVRITKNRIGFTVTDGGGIVEMGNDGAGISFGTDSELDTVEGNDIAHNGGPGVAVMDGSYHEIRLNRIVSNDGLPIDLGGDGLDANDFADDDFGPNGRTNHPRVITAYLAGGEVFVSGLVNAAPSTVYTVDLYAEATGVEGFGRAQGYVGNLKVATPLVNQGAIGFQTLFKRRFAAQIDLPSRERLPVRGPTIPIELGWGLHGTATHYPSLAGTSFTNDAGTTSEFGETIIIRAAPTTTAAASAGDDRIELSSTDEYEVGDVVTVCPGCSNEETRTVTGLGSLIFDAPLSFAHAPGEAIVPFIRAASTIMVRSDTTAAFGAGTAVEVDFAGVTGAGSVEVERFRRPPAGIDGVAEAHVIPHRWVATLDSTLAFGDATEIRFRMAEVPFLTPEDPDALVVYHRATPGAGAFTALPTQIDSTGALVVAAGFTALGEFAIATDEIGLATPGESEPSAESQPVALAVSAFPNPASESVTIQAALPLAGDVQIVLYDALGREVETVLDTARPSGTHTVALDTRDLPAGVYVVRLVTPAGTASRILTVVR